MATPVKEELEKFVKILNLYSGALPNASIWNEIPPPDGEIMKQDFIQCVQDEITYIQGTKYIKAGITSQIFDSVMKYSSAVSLIFL